MDCILPLGEPMAFCVQQTGIGKGKKKTTSTFVFSIQDSCLFFTFRSTVTCNCLADFGNQVTVSKLVCGNPTEDKEI